MCNTRKNIFVKKIMSTLSNFSSITILDIQLRIVLILLSYKDLLLIKTFESYFNQYYLQLKQCFGSVIKILLIQFLPE